MDNLCLTLAFVILALLVVAVVRNCWRWVRV